MNERKYKYAAAVFGICALLAAAIIGITIIAQ